MRIHAHTKINNQFIVCMLFEKSMLQLIIYTINIIYYNNYYFLIFSYLFFKYSSNTLLSKK